MAAYHVGTEPTSPRLFYNLSIFYSSCGLCRCLWYRWKKDELEDKIYGEQRMLYGEMKFPEFMFKPSSLSAGITLHCDSAGVATDFGYTVLQRAICVPCLPGTFLDPSTRNCTRCPLNTYQDRLAARSCTRCHRNHYTSRRGRPMLHAGI